MGKKIYWNFGRLGRENRNFNLRIGVMKPSLQGALKVGRPLQCPLQGEWESRKPPSPPGGALLPSHHS